MANPPAHSRVTRFFSNPLVGMIGTAASVIGVVLALFFYFSGQKTRELTAFLHPIRTNVVRMGQASNLSVKFGGRPVDSDVTAVQITVWNRGALSIRPDNVLKPVAIVMPGRQVLQATITKQRRDVSNLRLNTTRLAEGRVPLDWDILEEGDAAVIQVVYAGDDTADVDIEGVIEGQSLVSLRQYPHKLQRPEEQLSRANWSAYAAGTMQCVLGVGLLYTICARIRRREMRWMLLISLIGAVCIVAFGVYILYDASRLWEPPFGF